MKEKSFRIYTTTSALKDMSESEFLQHIESSAQKCVFSDETIKEIKKCAREKLRDFKVYPSPLPKRILFGGYWGNPKDEGAIVFDIKNDKACLRVVCIEQNSSMIENTL